MATDNGQSDSSDEFGAGITAGFERDDAQAAFDAKLLEIDAELDLLLADLTAPTQAAIAAAQDESISLRAELGGVMAREQLVLEGERDALEADLVAPLGEAIDRVVMDAEIMRDAFVLPDRPIRPSEPADVTGAPGVPPVPVPEPITPFPTGRLEFFTAPGTNQQLQLCVERGGIQWVAFPGIGPMGPFEFVLEPDPTQLEDGGGLIEGPGTPGQFAWTQSIRIDGPGCEDGFGGPIFTSVVQSTRPTFYGDFGADACVAVASCWREPTPRVPPEPLVTEPPVGVPVPPNGVVCPEPIECPPTTDVVVALDCEARILVVRQRAEIADDPRFLPLGDAAAGAEFGLDALCAECGITGEPPPGVPPLILPPSRTPREAEAIEVCRIPNSVFWPGFSQADYATERVVLSLDSAAVQRILGIIPFLNKVSPDITAALTLQRELRTQSNETIRTYAELACPSDSQRYIDLVNARANYLYLNNAFPGLFTEAIRSVDQKAKETCPKDLPPPAGIVAAFLANEISAEETFCWLRGHGLSTPQMIPVVNAQRQKPTLGELITMLRRGIIDRNGFERQAREAGWLNLQDISREFAISELIPGPSDVIRMMVRDAADPNIDWTQSDATFTQKYRGQLKQWGEWQGIPEEAMKFNWRSHWEIPPSGQLFTMMHRLGRDADGTINPAFRDRVKRALEQNDLMPDWVDETLAINFRLPRRADLRRVFRVGIFSEQELFTEFVKQGLETQTARGLVEFEVREKKRAFANNPLVAKFSRGSINAVELRFELLELGADVDAQDAAIKRGKLLMKMRRRDRCLEAIRHRVLIGEIDRNEAEVLAQVQTQDADQAAELADMWQCERDAKSKTTTAAELCKWFKDSVIDAAQFMRQLRAIGFPRELAEAKFQQCQIELNRKISAAEERARKAEQRRADKQTAQVQTLSRQSEAATAARLRNLQAARRATDRREKKVTTAAKTLANRNDLPYDVTLAAMMRVYRARLRLGILDADELANAVLTAAQVTSVTGLVSWEGRLNAILDAVGRAP